MTFPIRTQHRAVAGGHSCNGHRQPERGTRPPSCSPQLLRVSAAAAEFPGSPSKALTPSAPNLLSHSPRVATPPREATPLTLRQDADFSPDASTKDCRMQEQRIPARHRSIEVSSPQLNHLQAERTLPISPTPPPGRRREHPPPKPQPRKQPTAPDKVDSPRASAQRLSISSSCTSRQPDGSTALSRMANRSKSWSTSSKGRTAQTLSSRGLSGADRRPATTAVSGCRKTPPELPTTIASNFRSGSRTDRRSAAASGLIFLSGGPAIERKRRTAPQLPSRSSPNSPGPVTAAVAPRSPSTGTANVGGDHVRGRIRQPGHHGIVTGLAEMVWTEFGRPECHGVENRPGSGGDEPSAQTPFVTRRNSSFSASAEPAATV